MFTATRISKMKDDTYYSIKNKAVSNSKISDWINVQDPSWWYRRYVTGEIPPPQTNDTLLTGKALDVLLTDSRASFNEQFVTVSRRTAIGEPDKNGQWQLTQTITDKVLGMAEAIQSQKCYTQLISQKPKAQHKLLATYTTPEGSEIEVCGIPDWYVVLDDTIVVYDLKTAKTTDPRKYHYHCLEYGYYRQAYLYGEMLRTLYNKVHVKYRHLVVSHDERRSRFDVRPFKLDPIEVSIAGNEVKKALDEIAHEKEYAKVNLGWEDAQTPSPLVDQSLEDWNGEI